MLFLLAYLYIYVFFKRLCFIYLTELGLCCCTRAFCLAVASGGYSALVLHRLPLAVASLAVEHRL